jgi:trimethylamine--corrinoid protein Co-methyltransferase
MSALAGANLIYGSGMLDLGMTMDYGQLVIDDEFAAMIKKTIYGIPVNDEELSVDIIHEVGPMKDFMSHRDTYDNMRIHSNPKFIDRRMRGPWVEAGSPDIHFEATEHAKKLIKSHTPPIHHDEAYGIIQAGIDKAESELGIIKKT